jgi:hypothetical protein
MPSAGGVTTIKSNPNQWMDHLTTNRRNVRSLRGSGSNQWCLRLNLNLHVLELVVPFHPLDEGGRGGVDGVEGTTGVVVDMVVGGTSPSEGATSR